MKIKSIKANQTQIELNDGTIILVSYETPVAAFIVGRGIVRTSKKWSTTTTRHINQWIRDEFSPHVTIAEESQAFFHSLLECSNLCHPDEKCTITANGKCDAVTA